MVRSVLASTLADWWPLFKRSKTYENLTWEGQNFEKWPPAAGINTYGIHMDRDTYNKLFAIHTSGHKLATPTSGKVIQLFHFFEKWPPIWPGWGGTSCEDFSRSGRKCSMCLCKSHTSIFNHRGVVATYRNFQGLWRITWGFEKLR